MNEGKEKRGSIISLADLKKIKFRADDLKAMSRALDACVEIPERRHLISL
jgi:hypothetical protein